MKAIDDPRRRAWFVPRLAGTAALLMLVAGCPRNGSDSPENPPVQGDPELVWFEPDGSGISVSADESYAGEFMATIDWSNKSATVSTVTFALENVPVGLEISLGDAVLDPAYFWKAPLTVRATEPCSPMSGFFDVLCEVTSSDGDIGYLRIEVPVRLECPPGQELIVFSNRPPSGAPESDSEIWKMDLGTGAATRLTGDHQQIEDLDPAWSPDRSEIVFVSNRADPSSFAFDLVLMDLDGNDQKALTDLGPQNQSADDPAWSPAAGQRRIAFTIGQTAVGSKDIWILDLDEPESSPDRLRQITTGGNNDTSPTWSPDGQKIAFIRNGAIHVVPAAGGAPSELYSPPISNDSVSAIDWGPTGIVFDLYVFSTARSRLARIDEAGGSLVDVTAGGTHIADGTPSWAASSESVVFVRAARLFTSIDGGAPTEALEITGQPDGENSDPDCGFPPPP